ncbi:MAG: putative membrane protein, partial [Rhodothermales bacterium]
MRILLLFLFAISALADRAVLETTYAKTVLPLLKEFCYECHADGKAKGDVSLDGHANLDAFIADVRLTDRISDVLAFGEMPPKKADQLSDSERQELLAWMRGSQAEIRTDLATAGYVPPRRLNSQEYTNTVRDLLGV